jgi:hypothetical protein
MIFDEKFYSLEDYDGEVWREMNEFGNEFLVSNMGRIKRKKRIWGSGRQFTTIKTIPESIVKQRIISDGYVKTTICYNGVKKSYSVHVLVAKYFIPNPNKFPQVNHKDGDKTNNCLDNLEWCTASQNVIHSARILHPNTYGKAKKDLGKEKADAIRKFKSDNPKASYNFIAEMFGCSKHQAFNAIKSNTYSK